MATFRKLPVEIEAARFLRRDDEAGVIHFNEDPPEWLVDGMNRHASEPGAVRRCTIETHEDALLIFTLEGDMICSPGDWIIRGVTGELYPCKPDIFQRTYERA